MTQPLPIPSHVRNTVLAALDIMRDEVGDSRNLHDTRAWLRDLEEFWPSLESVPEGRDMFPQHPIAGECTQ